MSKQPIIIRELKLKTMNPKNNLPPIHPGEFLKEILDELDISQAEFARAIGLSAMRISGYPMWSKARGPLPPSWPCFSARRLAGRPNTGSTCRRSTT
jgi:hypothetical protein